MVDVLAITRQPLSSILGSFYCCLSCNTVDRDPNRVKVGYHCPRCGKPSKGARIYFPITALSLVDLMQGFYHIEGNAVEPFPLYNPKTDLRLATVVFFCSLGDVLLTHLLKEIMLKQGVVKKEQDRLLADNLSLRLRVDRLYPALTQQKWTSDLKQVSTGKGLDYLETNKLFLEVNEGRNRWLHQGKRWGISPDLPKRCVQAIWPLLCLFVALHNKYAVAIISDHRREQADKRKKGQGKGNAKRLLTGHFGYIIPEGQERGLGSLKTS